MSEKVTLLAQASLKATKVHLSNECVHVYDDHEQVVPQLEVRLAHALHQLAQLPLEFEHHEVVLQALASTLPTLGPPSRLTVVVGALKLLSRQPLWLQVP